MKYGKLLVTINGYRFRFNSCFSLSVFKGVVQLPPGTYNYTLQHYLPEELPSSFVGKSGHITYTVCVSINIPGQADIEFETPFTVIKAFDLNADQIFRVIPSNDEIIHFHYPN